MDINMCGRYTLFDSEQIKEIREIIREVERNHPGMEMKRGEIYPTNLVPIMKAEQHLLKPDYGIWGFPNFRTKGVIINARSETAAEKNLFRTSLLDRRCVIPSTGYYEWTRDKEKKKYLFKEQGKDIVYLAGFYNQFQGERRFVILTTVANTSVADIHNRMPIILQREQIGQWVTDTDAAMRILRETPPQMLKELA